MDNPDQQYSLQDHKVESPLAALRAQIMFGPLPAALARLRQQFGAHRAAFILAILAGLLILIVIVGLAFGSLLGRLYGPKTIIVSELPSVTPTAAPQAATRFDSLRDLVTGFTGLLPDPAPPAVDNNINLQPAKR